jgi:hypothetical protein
MSRRCCCAKECEVFVDDFNRADSLTVGQGWNEYSGNWEIKDFELAEDGAGGLIITPVGISDTQRRVVRVTCLDAQSGKKYRIAACVEIDAITGTASYLYVEFACDASNVAYIRVGTSSDTSGDWSGDTPEHERTINYVPGTDYVLIACLTTEGIYGTIATISDGAWACITHDGAKAGLVSPESGGIEYDNFMFHRHAEDINEPPLCIFCMCECDGHCIPKTLKLTLESSCPGRDGLGVTLNFDYATLPSFEWYGSAVWPNPHDSGSSTVEFRLVCRANNESTSVCDDEFYLCSVNFDSITGDWGSVSGLVCDYFAVGQGECAVGVICSPLEIQFRAALTSVSPPCDPYPCECSESIVITEP